MELVPIAPRQTAPQQKSAPPLRLRVASVAFWSFVSASSIALFPVAVLIFLLTWPFDRNKKILHQFTCAWGSLYTIFGWPWPVTVTGRQHIRKHIPYVMVANHQSLVDVLLLFRLMVPFKWVSKASNFRVPFVGWNMRLNSYIKLERGNSESIAQMLVTCEDALKAGNSVMLFPEGTRSRDGRLRAFKHGAFTLAKRTNAPIIPIVIEGSGNALPKAGIVLKGYHEPITIRVLAEIGPDEWPDGGARELAEHVRTIFERELSDDTERPSRGIAHAKLIE